MSIVENIRSPYAILPLEIINGILCYFVNDTNYVDLMVLSKNIKKYLTKYIMPLLAKSCVNQYTTDISLPQTININLKYSGTCISRNVNRYALKKMRQKRCAFWNIK